jgi:DMSO/TMAO reductase YedYZ molybdopterin-dependent catalytic subunit
MKLRYTILFGALAGALITAPLMGILYLAEQAANLPFVPFDLFDWMARVLPGDIVIRSIETMVDIITSLNLGQTDTTAKTMETLSALAMFFGGGVVGGVILFILLRQIPALRKLFPGLIFGFIYGLPMTLISLHEGSFETSEAASAIWLLAWFVIWGGVLHWTYSRLSALTPAQPEAEAATDAAGAPARPGDITVETEMMSRRAFLIRVGGATAVITVVGAGIGRYLEYQAEQDYQASIRENRAASAQMPENLPNADDPVKPAPGTRPEYTPLEDHYRIDINIRPPEVNVSDWRLKFHGLVDEEVEFTIDDLQSKYEPQHQYITLACISNPIAGDLIGTTYWTGARLSDVLADVPIQEGATHLKITSVDGFFEIVALDLINSEPRIMLTYNWDGIPLLHEHGFPLRIYIPDRYGMKQPKWMQDIEVIDHDEDGYWVKRGWDKVARMRTTSVIDVVASDRTFEQDGQTLVPVGGIAHAGARGISKVEVRVNEGDWVEAQLRSPLSQTTWVIWRYDWPFESGQHKFEVRCYDGDGTLQVTDRSGTFPDGATGIDSLTRTI